MLLKRNAKQGMLKARKVESDWEYIVLSLLRPNWHLYPHNTIEPIRIYKRHIDMSRLNLARITLGPDGKTGHLIVFIGERGGPLVVIWASKRLVGR